ncbi:fatty acid synthase-like [Leptopilina heterotoma]|uniref:fatty acid synthase-like n=1 Tax=Leptopilina heterotoma TaxID=63436 RepID=UPI001CA87B83|nr:fatty acid synthase-like [Leptopilina heterotoma]
MEPIMTGDEIVISGISGKFPNSENVNKLQNNLLNKIDCVTDSKVRWNFEHPDVPPRIGVMKSIDTFDRIFFGIHGKLVDCMDPMVRMMIETTYEAITDAGINPKELKGSKSAVFTGSSFSESEKTFFFEKLEQNGFGLLGASRAMLANRLSFFFGLTGPSVNVDSTCCGGMTALDQGIAALREGRAESAIIGASNVVLHPNISYQLFQLGLLSPDGITKSFDNKANGYTRSEGLVVLFLQRARDAKRIYAEVKSARMFFGNVNDNYPFFLPTHDSQSKNMQMTLKEAGLLGKDISYVEADGSGIKDMDAEEVKAIDEVYNVGRHSPLLIGSIKSNIGSCSATSPLNGIIKVITAMEKGFIPPNLHFKETPDKIPAIKEGRCKVVTELTPWTGDYAVVNSLALSGASANVVLKNYKKDKKNGGKPDDNLSRLVTVSGCTEEAVDVLLSDLESRPADVEMLQLLYDVFDTEIPAHLYRGYTLLPPDGLVKNKTREIQFNTGLKREIWYMFSGMGSQWVGMGEALLEIPVFAEAIKKCDRVLKPRGIDIVRIITEKDPKMFDNIVNSFVGIAAIQIGLVDVLDSVGLKPDFLIGHSVGELGCAYADGCFTAEQMVLAALSRGLASVETEMPRGSMAAVGLGYEEIQNLCPTDIDVACHNSLSSSTISGPADSMKAFVAHLTDKKIFAKEVACSNIAYHSRYIAPAGEKLKKYLQEVIPNPKLRSNRWVSSSVPRDEWNSARARLSSAEYHTNNLLNAVLFAETAKSIPSNAVVIEIAPHGLLQAIVKKSLPENVLNVPLTKRGHPDNASFIFTALGKIYNAGYNVKISNLYPKVNYPVSRGTPSISSIIRWDHSANWYTNFFKQANEVKEGEMKFTINLKDEKWKYLEHNKIDDKVIVPSSLYLTLAWEVLKSLKEKSEESVVYENIKIHKHQVELSKDKNIELVVMVQKGTGSFEITNNEELLCSGIIQTTNNPNQECSLIPKTADKEYQDLSESDIYTELQMRGLKYSGLFRCIRKASGNGSNGVMVWKDDWTAFLEGMIQMHILGSDTRKAQVPITIRKVIINLKLQKEVVYKLEEIPVTVYRGQKTVNAGGVQMEGIAHRLIRQETYKNNVITEKLQIVPGTDGAPSSLTEILKITIQLLQDNLKTSNLIHIVNDESTDSKNVKQVLENILQDSAESKRHKVDVVSSTWLTRNKSDFSDIALLILSNIEKYTPEKISNIISDGKFVLAFTESKNVDTVLKMVHSVGAGLVLKKYPSNNQIALLLRQKQTTSKITVLDINDSKDWSSQIKTVLRSKDYDRLIIAIRSKQCSYICKNIEVLQKERNGHKIQIVDILDPKVSNFSLDDSLISSHMNLDLKMNILLPGKIWGTYTHTPIASNVCQAENWNAKQMKSSDLESIKWVEGISKRSEDAIKVEYSSVNQSDILSASTKTLSKDYEKNRLEIRSFGQEYSGINAQGKRVMGIVENAAFSNYIESNINFTWKLPENWSLEDAATVPLAYATAYLALIKGELKNNESIFIYDGTCSIGQAAINLVSNVTSQVFAGYTTNNDKKNLKDSFSNIPENHLISTSGTFPDQILAKTNGNGVNVVIYNGDDLSKIETCLMCVKNQGRIIVVGNLQQAFSKSVGMEIFLREIGIFSIVTKKIINLDLATKKKLSQLIENGLLNRTVKPLPRCVYSRDLLKDAFIHGASKKVFGKILVKIQPEDGSNIAPSIHRFSCKSEASYLIIEGLSDFGLELVDFLAVRGARSIVIASESKSTRAFSNHRISLWRSYGVSVTIREELDLTHRENGNALLEEVGTFGTVDAIFDLQRLDNSSRRSSNAKYLFTKHLFEESRQMCPNLRHFIIFSTSKVIGETIDDFLLREVELTKICQPNSKGVTGLLILLGPVSGIAEKTTEYERNVPLLSIYSIIKQLDILTGSNTSIASVYHKSEDDTEKVPEHFHAVKETEKSKFVKYINSDQSLGTFSRYKITDEN